MILPHFAMFCEESFSATHRIEEFAVVLGRLDLVEQEFHRFEVVHVVEQLAQHPHFLQNVGQEQQFLAAGAGAIDVDRRIDTLFGHASIEVDFQIAGTLELFVDDVVHAAAGVDQGGGDDGQRTAFLDVARGAEEALRLLQGVGVDAAGEHLAGSRLYGVVGG